MTPLAAVAPSSTRLGLPVLETPASVDVVTKQTIQDQGYHTTTDTAQGAVGVLSGDAPGAPANFSMRGFAFGQINTLYNGIWTGPSDITSRWMDTANLDHVEFLKGPSSLMSGLNAIGGAVNYVTAQPTSGPVHNEFDASIDSGGSFRTHYGSGGSTAIKGLDYRVDLTGSKLDSFIDGDFRDLTDFSGQLNYHVADNFMLWGAAEYKKDSGHAYWGTPLVPTSFAGGNAVSGVVSGTAVNTFSGSVFGPVTIDSRTLTTNYNIGDNATGAHELWVRGGFEWSPLNNVTVKDQVYSWTAKANWIDSETYSFDDGSVFAPNTIDRDRFFVTHDQHMIGNNLGLTVDSNIFGMENRLASQLELSRNWITFVEEGNDNADFPADNVNVVNPNPGTYAIQQMPNTRISKLTDVAESIEDRLKITPEFALIGGVRVEALTLDRSGSNFDGSMPTGIPFTQTWTPVSYRAAYTYEPIPKLVFYSMYGTAYNPADANGVFSINNAGTTSSLALTSTRIYETGVKQQLWDDRAEWTVSLYDIHQKNVLVPISDTAADLAGGVGTKGVEIAGAVSPVEGLKLWANSAWTHAKFTSFNSSNGDFTGNGLPNVAPIIVNAGASYRFVRWRWPVEFGGSVRHVGNRFLDQTNLTVLDSYTTGDVYALVDIPGADLGSEKLEKVRVSFRVRNVANKVYAAWSDSGTPDQVLLGAPRTYEVAASARW